MADKNKRDWFATGDSDEEEQGYDSEVEESKGKSFAARSSKRRKLDADDSNSEDDESDDELATRSGTTRKQTGGSGKPGDEDLEVHGTLDGTITTQELEVNPTLKKTKDKAKLAKKLAAAQAKASKTGVIYISRVPPYMKPHTLKNLLKPYAPSGLERVFLTPEDPTVHKSRVKSGGNKKKQFLDGWIEFVSKKEAKLVAETLNGHNIGGKKGSRDGNRRRQRYRLRHEELLSTSLCHLDRSLGHCAHTYAEFLSPL